MIDEALGTVSDNCATSIKLGITQIEIVLRETVGQRNMNQKFKLCDPIDRYINSTKDVSSLFETLAGNFASIVQYNRDNRIGKERNNITIDSLCTIMDDDGMGPPIDRLSAINDMLLASYNQTCLDYKYDKMVEQFRNVNWGSETAEGGQ